VYFVPTDEQCAELLNKVEEFCTSLGVRLLRYPVQNTDAQKAEIADAVAGGIEVDVEEHIKAVEKYSPTTRQDVFAHRRELIRQTALLLIRLSLFLNGRANELGRKLEECESRMKTLESQASVASQSSGRRILPAKAG
jgi:acyl-CoA reductase-like NAD-dependent aldehyde dehydrogenase